MTDNEIIKALECCLVDNNDMAFAIECHGCAFDFDGDGVCCENCSNGIAEAAISVINRQKEEIDDLKRDTLPKLLATLERANRYGIDADKENEQLKAEITRLEDILRCQADGIIELDCNIAKAKSEAIKDFAEKLKRERNGIISNDWNHKAQPVSWAAAYEEFVEDIDRLLNEMVGDGS